MAGLAAGRGVAAHVVLWVALAAAGGCGATEAAPREGVSAASRDVMSETRATPLPQAGPVVREGEEALAAGDVTGARTLFERAIATDPKDARAHFGLGSALEIQGDASAATKAYRSAIALHPDFAEAYANLGNLLRAQGQLDAAIRALQEAVRADPRLVAAHVNLALALEDGDDDEAAEGAYRTALRLAPHETMARVNLGLLLLRLDRPDGAALELQQALRAAPQERPVLLAIGSGLRQAGKPRLALQAMRAALDNGEPVTPALLAELALAQRAVQDRAGAVTSLRRALALDARYGTGHYLLANMLAADGQYAEAVRHYETYLGLEPQGQHAEKARARMQQAAKLR